MNIKVELTETDLVEAVTELLQRRGFEVVEPLDLCGMALGEIEVQEAPKPLVLPYVPDSPQDSGAAPYLEIRYTTHTATKSEVFNPYLRAD